MKKICLIGFLSLLCLQQLFANRENPTLQFLPTDLRLAAGEVFTATLYDEQMYDPDGTLRTGWERRFAVREARTVLTLFTNPFTETPYNNSYQVGLRCKLIYRDQHGAKDSTDYFYLHIDYNPEGGQQYRSKDIYTLDASHYTILKIDSVGVVDGRGAPINLEDVRDLFSLRYQLQIERYYTPRPSEVPVVLGLQMADNEGYLQLLWRPLAWAEYYDVEWTYVDNYHHGSSLPKPRSALPYDFKNNSTRVRIQATKYQIPLIFEKGYVLFRVRAVGLWGDQFTQPVTGQWSMADAGVGIPYGLHIFEVRRTHAHEREQKNWQHIATFAEEGKRKDVVRYLDGTLRERQLITNLSTDQQLLIQETVYDHQGRPAIEILPAPQKLIPLPPSSLGYIYPARDPAIQYYPKYNQNPALHPYQREDFDQDNPAGCGLTINPLHDNSGAGQYYSPNNPDKSYHQAYVPDAEGYPFVHTEYTPDKTGRIRRQGKPGVTHQLDNGHAQKYYYTVPSQDELDRFFGNEVGMAAHYKKEVLLDENGQTHLAFKDNKGNVVVSALAGNPPSMLDAIDRPAPTHITINLLEEEDRRETGSNSLVTSRSLHLSQSSTLRFNYQLTPERLEQTTCPAAGTLCYDCVYDLTIQVRDDCGAILYETTEAIGSLAALRTCETESFALEDSLTLVPGNYFIAKRLTVNQDALDQYVSDYLGNSCFADLELEWIEEAEDGVDPEQCNAPCSPCQYTEIEQSYELTQEDGSTIIVRMPTRFREETEGECVRICPGENTDPCAVAYEALLADMNPSGQYALFRDTTRRTSENPLGEVNPGAFPLSVLNEANELPIQGDWRHPAFDYRDPDGFLAYIEINEMGQPSHADTDIIVRDGKRYVKPQYLNDVEDFIRYWQDSWVESLVPFHPEYPYYLWCQSQSESHAYDTLMRTAETYSEALAQNLVNHLTLGLGNDPFFRDNPAAARIMMDSLRQFFILGTAGSPVFNIDETVYLVINCNNINYTDVQVEACARGGSLYSRGDRADKEWKLYKAFYLSMKRKVMDVMRSRELSAGGYFLNHCIGRHTTACTGSAFRLLFQDKTKRFPDAEDASTYLPTDIDEGAYAADWREFYDDAVNQRYQRCGTCPVASELLALLNGFTIEQKLTEEVRLPDAPPLTFTRNLADAFSIRDALEYTWTPAVAGSDINISITTGGVEVCSLSLSKDTDEIDWEEIRYFTCIEHPEGGDAYDFMLKGLTEDGTVVGVKGRSSCFNISVCNLPQICRNTPLLDELATFLGHMFEDNRYLSPSYRVHNLGESSPHFGSHLQAVHPDFHTWDWEFQEMTGQYLAAELVIQKPDGILSEVPITETCYFSFRIEEGFRYEDIASIVEVERENITMDEEQPVCNIFGFVITAANEGGQLFRIYGTNTCYRIANCCQDDIAAEQSCCLPFTPRVPFEDNCVEDARAIARENARRRFDGELRERESTMRAAYVDRCLQAAEAFTMNYTDQIYQATLHYYDQANNLVRTIPPKGVHTLTDEQVTQVRRARTSAGIPFYPNHQMATTYVYNTLNEVIEKTAPDEGTTRYCYDELGRIILSQDAVQAGEGTCSYLQYDALGRVMEAGKISVRPGTFPHKLAYATFETVWLAGSKTEIFKTYYDWPVRPDIHDLFEAGQQNLRNRVATITYQEVAGSRYDHATHYSYDVVGNIRELVQEYAALAREFPALGTASHHIKKVQYDYDLVSGNIHRVVYQPGEPDQFIHWYAYDADNRLTRVKTSTIPYEDEITKDVDATYEYYQHGPLARTALGMEKVQGLDYAYTIQGWLKGVNAGTLMPDRDIGRDGTLTGYRRHGLVALDVFGYTLGYFDGDYRAIDQAGIGAANMFTSMTTGSGLVSGLSSSLYDGNIQHMITANDAFTDHKVQAAAFRYDQLRRLTNLQIYRNATVNASNSWVGGNFTEDYKTLLSYDANGNIEQLTRKGMGGTLMDELTYHYTTANNQLTHVADAVGASVYDADLASQTAGNYAYDPKGRLTQDLAEGINAMRWTHTDKVKQITQGGQPITFAYDAQGRRVLKQSADLAMYYVRDHAGSLLATYTLANDTLTWQNAPVYGSGRLGTYHPSLALTHADSTAHATLYRGHKHYELAGYTGNVVATVTDRKIPSGVGGTTPFYADISTAQDYYPFGMTMPGRSLDSVKYAFGFQGMERDDDLKGEGNSYTTEFRQYDPRVGRWLSVDPAYYVLSSYMGFNNNTMLYTDINGDTVRFSQESIQNYRSDIDKIIEDWEFFTGYELYVDRDGNLLYRTDDDGDPIIREDSHGGRFSQREIRSFIEEEEVINVNIRPTVTDMDGRQIGSMTLRDLVLLDQSDIERQMSDLEGAGIDPRSMGWGMTLVHELYHSNLRNWPNEEFVVRMVNHFRREADYQLSDDVPKFRQRLRYGFGDETSAAEYFRQRTRPVPSSGWGCGCSAPGAFK